MHKSAIAALSICLFAAFCAQAAPPPKPPFETISPGRTFEPERAGVEVVEIFGPTCKHCFDFEPRLREWEAREGRKVRLVQVTLDFDETWAAYARAFYAAQELGFGERIGKDLLHAIHVAKELPARGVSEDDLARFLGRYGVSRQAALDEMRSERVRLRIERSRAYAMQVGVSEVPTLIVAGRFRISGRDHRSMLETASELVSRELRKSASKPKK